MMAVGSGPASREDGGAEMDETREKFKSGSTLSRVELASSYAAIGLHVFPVKITDAGEKVPLTEHGLNDSSTDQEAIRRWWAAMPRAEIGINCGRSGLVVVDLDVKYGADGPGEWGNLLDGREVPRTYQVRTRSGGWHGWFRDGGVAYLTCAGRPHLPPGVDVRAQGGFVVAPGSTGYTWHAEQPITLDDIPVMPRGILPERGTGCSTGHWRAVDRDELHPADQLALAALEDLGGHGAYLSSEYVAITRPGKVAGCSASIGHIGPGVVKVFTPNWPGLDEGRVYDADQLGVLGNGGDLGQDRGAEQSEDRGYPEADLANARLLAAEHKDRLRYVVPWKKWLVWDGTRWKPDETGEAPRCAKAVADTLPKRSTRGPSRSQTRAGLEAMLALAGTEPGIAVAPSMLDADPDLLNCANGTLDLRTGERRAHSRDDLLTKVCAAAYHPGAQAPAFTAFLERVQPDEVMRDFLARLFGHALLGKVVEHLLPVFYGIGANGKTTLVEAIAAALGDYADTVEPGLLLDRGEVHPTGVADLFGLRLAITHETDEGRRLAEGTVKRLTGGDRVKARRMREDFWAFDPSHSIVMHTNHKPVVRGTDEGIWRRLRFVPFPVVIPGEERDGKLPERLALERDGILAWIVAGYRQWQDRGLADPKPVTDATASFRTESDLLALFLEERCMTNPHAHVQSTELFAAWVEWCRRENLDAGTQTAFSRKITERGFHKEHTRFGKVWQGIGLYTDETASGDGL